MRFIRDFSKFRQLKINEALESGQFLAYHRTRLVEQSYVVKTEPNPNVNFYQQFADSMIFGIDKNSKDYQLALSNNINLLVNMNPDIKLDDRGFPVVKVGDKITTQDPRIISQGFRAGGGDWYGVGLYTCYEFDDQIRDFNNDGVADMSMYGKNIVEFKVENTGKFLILDMTEENNQAKKVWGPKHTLIDQLKKIMGGKFLNFYNKNKELIDGFNEILVKTKVTTTSGREEELKKDEQGRFMTASVGKALCHMDGFISLVDGISFTGGNDGRVLVVYDADLASPTRYTPDEGKTWIPMVKLEYQYERVRVGNKEILQCKIIDNDKELLQTGSVELEWLKSLDFPQILKDKKKSVTFLSKINLNEEEPQKNFINFIENLSNNKPQVIDNIVLRLNELPLVNNNLDEINNCFYLSNLAILLSKINKGSGQNSEILNKKLNQVSNFLLEIDISFLPIGNLSLLYGVSEKIKDKVINSIKNLNLLYSSDTQYRVREYAEIIDQIKKISSDIANSKIDEAIYKLIDEFKQVSGDATVMYSNSLFNDSNFDISPFKKIILLIGSNFDYLTEKHGDDFCKLLYMFMNSFHIYYKKLRLEKFNPLNSSRIQSPGLRFLPIFNSTIDRSSLSIGESDNILIRLIKISSGLNYKSVDTIVDCVILYLLAIKDDDIVVDRDKVIGQIYISKKIQGTKIFDKIQDKLLKLKNGEDIEICGVKPNFDFQKAYDGLSKFIKIEDGFDKDLDYSEIADKIFKSMYGFGVKEDELINQFDKLRNNTDFNKVKVAFGTRKGVIGKEYDLDYWIKDELKKGDLDKLNNLLKEKGINYQF